jgi:hypothetical protein
MDHCSRGDHSIHPVIHLIEPSSKSEEVIVETLDVPPEIDPKMEKEGIFLSTFCRMVLVPLVMGHGTLPHRHHVLWRA